MTEVYIIPHGEHLAFYRQFGKLNRIEPIQLETGEWCIPTRVLPHFDRTYVMLKQDQRRFDKRKDATLSTVNYAESTIQELDVYPKRNIEQKDIHSRYKEEIGVNGRRNLIQRIFRL